MSAYQQPFRTSSRNGMRQDIVKQAIEIAADQAAALLDSALEVKDADLEQEAPAWFIAAMTRDAASTAYSRRAHTRSAPCGYRTSTPFQRISSKDSTTETQTPGHHSALLQRPSARKAEQTTHRPHPKKEDWFLQLGLSKGRADQCNNWRAPTGPNAC